MSVFRTPSTSVEAAKKRTWAFSAGFVLLGIGIVNLLVGWADQGVNFFIGVCGLILGIALIGQGILLLGHEEK